MNNKTFKQETTGEYSRILTAAVINLQFRQLLLANPGKAIERGYGGETFSLASRIVAMSFCEPRSW